MFTSVLDFDWSCGLPFGSGVIEFQSSQINIAALRTRKRSRVGIYSGSNNYLIPCLFCRFAQVQRMELYIILIIGTF